MSTWKNYKALGALDKFSVVSGAVGSFYAASAEKYKTKSLALSLQHKKDMSLFNMRQKESQAQHIMRSFNKQYQIMTLKQGRAKSKNIVSIASRGCVRGVGSNLESIISNDILAEIDKMTMNSNKVRAAENKRLEAVGLGIQGSMYGMSASNMFATASSISPFMNMSSSLLTGAGNVLSSLPSGMLTNTTATTETPT